MTQLKTLRRKVFADLRANRGQFLAVWLVITLGITFYGAMYPAGMNMLNTIYKTYDDLHFLDFKVQASAVEPDMIGQVQAIPGVEAAEGRLVYETGVQTDPASTYVIGIRLISVPDDGPPQVSQSEVIDGHAIREPDEVLLLRAFADEHGYRPGDTVRLVNGSETHDYRIAGLVFNPEYLVAGRSPEAPFPVPSTFGIAWMRYSELASLAGREGELNEIAVRLEGKSDDDRTARERSVLAALNTLFADDGSVIISSRIQTASGGVVDALINGNFPLMMFYSGLFLVGATLVTAILLARLVESDRRRIGTMRSLGVTRRELVVHYMTFGLLIGIAGGLAGTVLGYLNSFWVMDTFLQYISGGTLPGFVNRPQIPFMLLGLAVAVIGSTFAGAYPAWVQSATPPGIALRPATPKTPNALSRAPLGFLPLSLRQTMRNLLRAPGRSAGTALGMMAGCMMMFSSLAMWDTMDVRFGDFFDANAFDMRVDMATLTPGDALERQFGAIDGVAGAQAVLVGAVSVQRALADPYDTVAVSLDETRPFFRLETIDGEPAFSRADGVWIGNNMQRVLDLAVGETIRLVAFGQEHEVRVLGVVSYVLGGPVFVPRSLLVQWTPGGVFPANAVLLRAEPGQKVAVRDAAAAEPGALSVEVFSEFQNDLNHYLEYFRVGTIIFGSFGYILSLALLYNTVNASLRERRDELSILRALGSSRREIALTVTLELLIMVLIGAAVGIPVGREAGFVLNHSYQAEFFGQADTILLRSYLLGLASLLIVVFVAEIPGLRAVQRVDLGQVSKAQSF